MPETRINKEVFDKFPGFRRGIVVARKMDNQGSSKELETLLKEALAGAAAAPIDLKTDPRTAVWNETYRALGCNPNKFSSRTPGPLEAGSKTRRLHSIH